MKEAEYDKQLGTPTLEFVLAYAAHMRRFMQPETKHRAPCQHFLRNMFGLIWSGGYRRKCHTHRNERPGFYSAEVLQESYRHFLTVINWSRKCVIDEKSTPYSKQLHPRMTE